MADKITKNVSQGENSQKKVLNVLKSVSSENIAGMFEEVIESAGSKQQWERNRHWLASSTGDLDGYSPVLEEQNSDKQKPSGASYPEVRSSSQQERRLTKAETKSEASRGKQVLSEANPFYNKYIEYKDSPGGKMIGDVKLEEFFEAYKGVSEGIANAEGHSSILKSFTKSFKGMRETKQKELEKARNQLADLTSKLKASSGEKAESADNLSKDVSAKSPEVVGPKEEIKDIKGNVAIIMDQNASWIDDFVGRVEGMKLQDRPQHQKNLLMGAYELSQQDFDHIARFPQCVEAARKYLNPGEDDIVDEHNPRKAYNDFIAAFQTIDKIRSRQSNESASRPTVVGLFADMSKEVQADKSKEKKVTVYPEVKDEDVEKGRSLVESDPSEHKDTSEKFTARYYTDFRRAKDAKSFVGIPSKFLEEAPENYYYIRTQLKGKENIEHLPGEVANFYSFYHNIYNPIDGIILGIYNYNTDDTTENDTAEDKRLENSEILYNQYFFAAQKAAKDGIIGHKNVLEKRLPLNRMISYNVTEGGTKEITGSCTKGVFPKTFTENSREYLAILGSVVGRRVIYMLKQHEKSFGKKKVSSIRVDSDHTTYYFKDRE